MHYAHAVLLPGYLPDNDTLREHLGVAMDRYYYDNPDAVSGEWDWMVVGGRWGGSWVLREGGRDGPISTEAHSMGSVEHSDGRKHTDCARLRELEFESLSSPYSWIDLAGDWHTKWLGPEKSGTQEVSKWEIADEEWNRRWMTLLQTIPEDTWLVLTDYHS